MKYHTNGLFADKFFKMKEKNIYKSRTRKNEKKREEGKYISGICKSAKTSQLTSTTPIF